jgi:hypothetical protein
VRPEAGAALGSLVGSNDMKANEISAVGSEVGTSVGSDVRLTVGCAVGEATGNRDGSVVGIEDVTLMHPTEFKTVLEKSLDRLAVELPTKIRKEGDIMPVKESRVTNTETWCGESAREKLSKKLSENVLRNT